MSEVPLQFQSGVGGNHDGRGASGTTAEGARACRSRPNKATANVGISQLPTSRKSTANVT